MEESEHLYSLPENIVPNLAQMLLGLIAPDHPLSQRYVGRPIHSSHSFAYMTFRRGRFVIGDCAQLLSGNFKRIVMHVFNTRITAF